MKILLIHNSYNKFSGEEAVLHAQEALLKAGGNEVQTYIRSSSELQGMRMGHVQGFLLGLYNSRSVREVRQLISRPPTIVHIHNLYPLISPAILPVIKKAGIPIVMTVHNYRLVCPNGLFFTHGEICERCAGGKEWNCIARNCEESVLKSTGYALRNSWARKKRYYSDNVDAFLCLTAFQENKLIENGFPAGKCHVLPNFLKAQKPGSAHPGRTFAFFAGRLNAQKGFDILAKAASLVPGIPFRIAGSSDPVFTGTVPLSENMILTGRLQKEEMENLFNGASFLVFASRSYEGFPMVFPEAMAAGIPVIAPRMAGYPEIIEDGFNGLLFNPGDADDLAKKIGLLWNDPELRNRLGENGRKKLELQYSPEVYYRKLMAVYEELILSSPQ